MTVSVWSGFVTSSSIDQEAVLKKKVPGGVLVTVVLVYVPLCRRRWLLGWSWRCRAQQKALGPPPAALRSGAAVSQPAGTTLRTHTHTHKPITHSYPVTPYPVSPSHTLKPPWEKSYIFCNWRLLVETQCHCKAGRYLSAHAWSHLQTLELISGLQATHGLHQDLLIFLWTKFYLLPWKLLLCIWMIRCYKYWYDVYNRLLGCQLARLCSLLVPFQHYHWLHSSFGLVFSNE